MSPVSALHTSTIIITHLSEPDQLFKHVISNARAIYHAPRFAYAEYGVDSDVHAAIDCKCAVCYKYSIFGSFYLCCPEAAMAIIGNADIGRWRCIAYA